MSTSQRAATQADHVEIPWEELARRAWEVREHARVHGPTRVGAAVFAASGSIYVGCNVEHRFRSHDVHAEVNALTGMVAAGDGDAQALLIAAERDSFTPCGGCLDWIFELGGTACLVAFQATPSGQIIRHSAGDLMPYYPR